MKVGDLVCSATDGALGLIAQVEEQRCAGRSMMGEHIYRISWLDEDESAWYYEHEVESVDEAR